MTVHAGHSIWIGMSLKAMKQLTKKVHVVLECLDQTIQSVWKYMRGRKITPAFAAATNVIYAVQVCCEKTRSK